MDPKNDWKRFRRLKVDTKSLNKRLKKAEDASAKHAHHFVLKRLSRLRDARRHIISWLVLVAVLIGAAAVQMAWFQNSYWTTAASEGGTYSEGMTGRIDTLNPLFAQSQAEQSATRLIFSSLYSYDTTGHLRPDMARSMEADKSGKVYTLKLREDGVWHDGQPVTADDVIYTVDLMKNSAVRSYLLASWSSVTAEKVDLYTVRFTLPVTSASFPHALTFSIVPKHILKDIEPSNLRESTFSISPIGSGPFKLRLLQTLDSDREKKIAHLTRWEEYHRGQVKLDRFEIHTYKNPEDVRSAFISNEINAAVDMKLEVDGEFAERSRTQRVQGAVYALFNTSSPQLSSSKVRQALQRSLNTEFVRKNVSQNATAFDLPLSSHQLRNTTLPAVPTVDAQRAAKLLDSAGWKLDAKTKLRTKNKESLTLRLVWSENADYKRVAESLASQWEKLGIKIEKIEFSASSTGQSFAQAVLQPRAYDVLINELVIGADADVFPYWHSSQATAGGLNFSNYRSDIADDALLSARLRSESPLRNEKYKSFLEEWIKDVPAIGLYQSSFTYTQSRRVQSFANDTTMPYAVDRYANVQYWTTERNQVYKTP